MMRDDDDSPLTAEEHDALRAVGAEARPPADLMAMTTQALRRRGWVGARARRGFAWSPFWGAAAAALAFVAGLALGPRWFTPAPAPAPQVASGAAGRYLLLLFEDENYQSPASNEAMADRVREYTAWARQLAAEGRLGGAEKLADGGRWLTPRIGGVGVGPLVADARRGAITGFFEILARDESEAVRIGNDCPHLRHGGTIELRRIDDGRD